ncbi:phage holin family protein [Spirillospora sp. CA-128828]|uniref:phage holin family protein n=1 Tax=Spirillospora sp. CA-128828 TaxID=3240033 RepID=UPI003D8BEA81
MSIVRQRHDGESQAGTMGAHRQELGHAAEFRDARPEAGTGELVRQAAQQVSELMRAELRLATAELKDKARHAGTGAGMFGGAGLVALYGIGALLAAAIAAIALALPVWAAALIIGGFLMLVAGVLALLGRAQTRRATPPKPERAMDEAKQAVAELKERATHR